jgi:hypothetical protein
MSDIGSASGWRRLGRRLFWPLVWLLLIAGIAVIIDQTDSYTNCVHADKKRDQYQALHENADTLGSLVVRKVARARLVGFCAAEVADKNERFIGALAGVALAIFTFYLWHATRGLRRFAELQGRDMQRLVRLARANALAGLRTSRAARTSANAAIRSVEIAERSLIATQRAVIMHNGFEQASIVDDKGTVIGWRIKVRFKNTGPTMARNTRSAIIGNYFKGTVTEGFIFHAPDEGPGVDLASQGEFQSDDLRFSIDVFQNVQQKRGVCLIWGGVRYNDIFDNTPRHPLDFCFEVRVIRDPMVMSTPTSPAPFAFFAYGEFNPSD